VLEIKNISKHFGEHTALSNMSMQFDSGKIHALLGPNGAGKTTLIRLINQILEPDSGSIYFKGKYIDRKFLNNIGYLPEERGMYTSMTVESYLNFLAELRGLERKTAKHQIDTWLDKFDIQSWRKKRIEELSKGMAQKIQFVSTVFHDPELLILDEPFSGFDPTNIQLMRGVLRELKEAGKTIVLSTHNMNNAETISDHITLIHKGKLVLDSNYAALKKQFSQDVYAVQFKGNMLAFANALWVNYDLIESKQIGENQFIAKVKLLNNSTVGDLISALMGNIEFEGVWQDAPSMEDIFIQLTQPTAV
jgi:ABC-2 type transport system ATP-binding protein